MVPIGVSSQKRVILEGHDKSFWVMLSPNLHIQMYFCMIVKITASCYLTYG